MKVYNTGIMYMKHDLFVLHLTQEGHDFQETKAGRF